MQPRSKARIWANDDMLPDGVAHEVKKAPSMTKAAQAAAAAGKAKAKAAAKAALRNGDAPEMDDPSDSSNDELLQELNPPSNGRLKQGRHSVALPDDSEGEGTSGSDSDDTGGDDEDDSTGDGGEGQAVVDSGVSDLDYLKSKMKKFSSLGKLLCQSTHTVSLRQIVSGCRRLLHGCDDLPVRFACSFLPYLLIVSSSGASFYRHIFTKNRMSAIKCHVTEMY